LTEFTNAFPADGSKHEAEHLSLEVLTLYPMTRQCPSCIRPKYRSVPWY